MTDAPTILEINLALQQRIGTPTPLFAAQHYYAAQRTACGCDVEYPSGAFDAMADFITEVTGISAETLRLVIRAEYERLLELAKR